MIPRIIHQSWKVREIPSRWVVFHESLRVHNPDWEFRIWSDEDNRALVVEKYPRLVSVYDGLTYSIQRADFMRPLYLHSFGGFYADLDIEGVRPIDTLFIENRPVSQFSRKALNSTGIILGLEHRRKDPPGCSNAFMGSVPDHPFWLGLIEMIVERAASRRGWLESRMIYVLRTTGPDVLEEAVARYIASGATDLTLCQPSLMFPQKPWERPCESDKAEAVVVHRFSGSWVPTFEDFETVLGRYFPFLRGR